jgi:aspartyl-tRNA(Asn)/glutamyl-tRNA(Gln) amidotransferase subunit A
VLGHEVLPTNAPFDIPPFGDLRTIEVDRKTIATRAFKNIDLLVLPTTTTTVPMIEQASGNPQALSAANTMFANYFGLPAISNPAGFDSRGLPIGIQIVGHPWEDNTVLALAHQCQTAFESDKRRPVP